jgi:hypothetical protein
MKKLLAIGLLYAAGAGCNFVAAQAITTNGKAYLVKLEPTQSSFWNCEAPGGEPVCYQTKKVYTRQPQAK